MSAQPMASEQEKMLALLNGPAGAPPPGMTPNLVNPPNLDAIIIPTLSLCITVTTIVVVIRLYSKLFLIRSIAYEDYVVLLAWIGQIGFIVPSIFTFKVGGGRHMWDIPLKNFFQLLYWLNICGILYGIIVCLIKISILLQYLRIFVPNRSGNFALYTSIQVVAATIVCFYFVDTIFEIIMCNPREKIWNLLMSKGHCFNSNAAYMATGIFNVISDFSILFIPIIPIWKLQMPLRKKIMMIAIFATGAVACVTSILRTYYTFKVVQSPDVSYNITIMGLWTWAEITTGIIISCLPVLPKFFRHFGPIVYRTISSTFSLGSKSHSMTGSRSEPQQIQDQTNSFERVKGESNGNGVYSNQTMRKGKYINLGELDVASSENDATNEWLPTPVHGFVTRREDLEKETLGRQDRG